MSREIDKLRLSGSAMEGILSRSGRSIHRNRAMVIAASLATVLVSVFLIAQGNDFIKIFLIATVFSVLGGLLGYFIGSVFFDLGIL